jgi:L-seryl-tRNA(Ser) seleniumtransferase
MEKDFRRLPSVDRLMSEDAIRSLQDTYPRELVVDLVRERLERDRDSIALGHPPPSTDEIVASVCTQARELASPSPRPVINASGVILHTNIGRAPLSADAIEAMDRASRGYCDLEFELDTGRRGSRNARVEQLLCQLTGAEAALVVNNNASAVLLALMTHARRKEVIVSRGQAVEIGGGFRIPEVMKQSGAKLVEVGTTNATYIRDFEQALTPRTAVLLRVHSSNFRVMGFTHSVTLDELVELGSRHGLPVFDDLGSGCLLETAQFGLDPEPTVQQSVSAGVGLATFSGDKLVGGPQAGIVVGKRELLDRMKKHPLARAVRTDKVRLAGLTATLITYLKGEATTRIPVWRMISAPLRELEARAGDWARALGDIARVEAGESMVGGGSLPGGTLPTALVAVGQQTRKKEQSTGQLLARRLRDQEPPLIGRLSGNVLLLDPRTVLPEEDQTVIGALREAAAAVQAG